MADRDTIEVCVVFAPAPPALPQRQRLRLPAGATVADALTQADALVRNYRSALGETLANIDVSIFGERRELAAQLMHGDRIELLRPLQRSPTEQRRKRQLRGAQRTERQ